MKAYKYSPPKYFMKQEVLYRHHNGNVFQGRIIFVETHYGSRENNKAYHIYSVMRTDKEYDQRPGFKRYRKHAIHIGEGSILEVIRD